MNSLERAIIVEAKKLIAALKLPPPGGVLWHVSDKTWYWHEKPVAFNAQRGFRITGPNGHLPQSALPPWPGPGRDSWIDQNRSEQ